MRKSIYISEKNPKYTEVIDFIDTLTAQGESFSDIVINALIVYKKHLEDQDEEMRIAKSLMRLLAQLEASENMNELTKFSKKKNNPLDDITKLIQENDQNREVEEYKNLANSSYDDD